MKQSFLLLLMLSLVINMTAQHKKVHPDIPVDTSYTIQSEFKKQLKYYPFIKIAEPEQTDSFIILENIVYETIGTRALHLDIFQPNLKQKKVYPLVVMIHGGGWRSGNKNMNHYMAGILAKNGYAAVCVEYRLSMEAPYPAAIQDVKTAIRWIRAHADQYALNPEKVALMGCSSGGQMAALIGSINSKKAPFQTRSYKQQSDEVQAVIDFDGVLAFIHPESSEGADKPGKPSAATQWLGVSSKDNPNRWSEASALTHVNAKSAPMLFINSAQPRFHAGQADMIGKLQSHGIYVEEHLIENTPHSFWFFHPWIDVAMNHTILFLKTVL